MTASFIVAMAARFVGGVSAGLLWALLAGYAVRMAPYHLAGRAMAVAMAGTPLALSIGIPAGTFVGNLVGWRLTFGLLSAIALLLVGWIIAKARISRASRNRRTKRVVVAKRAMQGRRPGEGGSRAGVTCGFVRPDYP